MSFLLDLFKANEIQASINRLNAILLKNDEAYPITYCKDTVGSLRLENNEIFVSYIGSINHPLEILSLIFSFTKKIEENHLKGRVHRNIYNKFQQIKTHLWSDIKDLVEQQGRKIEDIQMITVEGYSQGSLFVTLTAAYLSDLVGVERLKVITFASLGIFDQAALESYNKKLGTRHLSLLAEEDQLIHFNSLLKPGHTVKFSATHCHYFRQRVIRSQWTFLHRLAQFFIKFFISKTAWEAHMPHTYASCPKILSYS